MVPPPGATPQREIARNAGGARILSFSRAVESGACTPGFVASPVSRRPMAIHLGPRSLAASSGYPWRRERAAPVPFRAVHCSPCTEWGLPCLACCQPSGGLLPRRFTLACDPRGSIGGLFSVALSVALPRPAVSWHSALWCPEVPPGFRPAAIRPPTRPISKPMPHVIGGGQRYTLRDRMRQSNSISRPS